MYLTQSIDAVQAAVLRLMGPAFALQHSREVRLVATFIYYALTTGSGQQTLGEEYCDLLQRQPQHDPWRPKPPLPSSLTAHLAGAAGTALQNHSNIISSSASSRSQLGSSSNISGPPLSSSSKSRHVVMSPSSSLLPRKAALGLTVLQSLGPYLLERLISSLGSRGDLDLGFEDTSWLDADEQQQHASRYTPWEKN